MRKTIAILIFVVWSVGVFAATSFHATVTGIKGKALENAEKRVEKILSVHPAVVDPKIAEQLTRQLSNEIKDALSPYGYFDAVVNAKLTKRDNNTWSAVFRITPGQRTFISHIEVRIVGQGQQDPELRRIVDHMALKPGQPLITPKYNALKDNLLDVAASRGYFDAEMKQSQVTVNIRHHTASIHLILATGARYRFGTIQFKQINNGAKPLSQRLLKRFVQFKAGEPYDQTALFKLQEQLVASQYFDQVIITPHPKKSRQLQVPITAKLYASKSKRYQVGLGVGTDSGLRGLLGVKYRRLTTDGHYAELKTKGSIKNNNLSGKVNASYNIPGRNPAKDLYKITAEAQRDAEDNFGVSQNAKLGFSYITEIQGWQQTLGLRYQLEQSHPIDEPSFTSNLLMPSISWLRVKSDDPIKPNEGYKIVVNGRGSSRYLLSDTSFAQAWINTKWLSTFHSNFRLILRADLGIVAISNIDDLPLSLRFAAGGTQTIRGYGFKDIKDGRTMSIASMELQHRLYQNFYLAGFYDFGDIGPQFFSTVKRGAGVGLVWRAPIGAVSLTIAKALDKPGQPRRIELSMGPEL